MDEKTPHIYASVVPIVMGEYRKAQKEQANGQRKYDVFDEEFRRFRREIPSFLFE